MSSLERTADWDAFVSRAVDDLLHALSEDAEAGRDENFALRPEASLEASELVRERLTSYSMSLLSAARAGTGTVVCNNGVTTVDCTFVLRPHETPYHRCLHSPPDCYDASGESIVCP